MSHLSLASRNSQIVVWRGHETSRQRTSQQWDTAPWSGGVVAHDRGKYLCGHETSLQRTHTKPIVTAPWIGVVVHERGKYLQTTLIFEFCSTTLNMCLVYRTLLPCPRRDETRGVELNIHDGVKRGVELNIKFCLAHFCGLPLAYAW